MVGTGVGSMVGTGVGCGVGTGEGRGDGAGVGCSVGTGEGCSVGTGEGSSVGTGEGRGVGRGDGRGDGMCVGAGVGTWVHVILTAKLPSSSSPSPSTRSHHVSRVEPSLRMSYVTTAQAYLGLFTATTSLPVALLGHAPRHRLIFTSKSVARWHVVNRTCNPARVWRGRGRRRRRKQKKNKNENKNTNKKKKNQHRK